MNLDLISRATVSQKPKMNYVIRPGFISIANLGL